MSILTKGLVFLIGVVFFFGTLSLFSDTPANLLSLQSVVHHNDDPLFEKFPHTATYRYKNYTEKGKPVDALLPLHMRKGHFAIIASYADYDALLKVIKEEEGPHPGSADFAPLKVKRPNGKISGVAYTWLANYEVMDLGPYEEVVFCMAITNKKKAKEVFTCHDEELCPAEIFNTYDNHCFLLFLNSDLPIAYGREILGTNKHKMTSKVKFEPKTPGSTQVKRTYDFKDVLLAELNVDLSMGGAMAAVPRLIKQQGFKKTFRQLWDSLNDHQVDYYVRFSRGITTIVNSDKVFTSCRFSGKFKEFSINVFDPKLSKFEIYNKQINSLKLEHVTIFNSLNARGIFFPPSNIGDGPIKA